MWCWCQYKCHHKCDAASHYNCLYLTNVLVPLIIPLASCKSTLVQLRHWQYHQHHMMPMPAPIASHDQKRSCYTSFQLSSLNKCNGSIDVAITITICRCWCQWHHITKKVKLCVQFHHLDVKCKGALDDTVGIMWDWHQYQWHHVIRNIMLHIVSVILT